SNRMKAWASARIRNGVTSFSHTTSWSPPPSITPTVVARTVPPMLLPADRLACTFRSVTRTCAYVPTGTFTRPCTVVYSPLCRVAVTFAGEPRLIQVAPSAEIATWTLPDTDPVNEFASDASAGAAAGENDGAGCEEPGL